MALLTADWRDLALLNFQIAPERLAARVPSGTELDSWRGRTLVSVVGLRFSRTRLFGVWIPGHAAFEEVNLRFYVKRSVRGGWRRGVVFVKELVPLRAVAWAARKLYGEPYEALPMHHAIVAEHASRSVRYTWTHQGRESSLSAKAEGAARAIQDGSEEEFIAEHHWGYTRQRDRSTLEYQVEHPRWNIRTAHEARLDCDVRALYGADFAEALSAPPCSAFLSDGSAVRVHRGVRI